jgi:hypothetical protein
MNNVAQTRTLRQATKLESAFSTAYVLPGMLAVNTVALLALDQLGGVPSWLKTITALFLAF